MIVCDNRGKPGFHAVIHAYIPSCIYDNCGYVNVFFVGNLPATGDVYGSSLCRLMMKGVKSLQHIISFTCDSFTPYSSSVAKCSI